MMKNRTVRLSQCMIVKNEEKNIEKALAWAKDIAFEQIVVDTGSTDRTVEIAKNMGAIVYSFEWIDDFAAAKNFAISKAKGDWIAFLDADEYLTQEDAAKLIPLLSEFNDTPFHVMLTPWINFNSQGRIFAVGIQYRVFKNMAGLRYKNRIHEELSLAEDCLINHILDASEEFAVYHTGYSGTEVEDKNKGERNARLILMELEEHPEDYNMMGYLADAYYVEDMQTDEAEKWYRKSIDFMPQEFSEYDVRSNMTYIKLLTILCDKEQESDLNQIYEKAVNAFPKESDYDYLLGRYYTMKQDYDKGIFHLERAISLLEEYGTVNKGTLLTGYLHGTWELLAMCYYQNGSFDKCVKWCVTLLKVEKYAMSTLVMLLCAFQSDEIKNRVLEKDRIGAEDIAIFLGNIYHYNELKDRIFLLRSAMEASYDDFVKVMRGMCTPDELLCFERSMDKQQKK